jgi:hypothetical protein
MHLPRGQFLTQDATALHIDKHHSNLGNAFASLDEVWSPFEVSAHARRHKSLGIRLDVIDYR